MERVSALEQEVDSVAEEVLHLFTQLRVHVEFGVGAEQVDQAPAHHLVIGLEQGSWKPAKASQ